MFKSLKKKNNKGFTLVELVIVVAILAILVGILAPQYTKYVEKSRKAADASNLENLVTVVKTAASDSTDTIPADKYTIKITADGTTISDCQDASKTAIEAALDEFAGDGWEKTVLKSKKWSDSKNAVAISASITVDENGAVTVSYDPEELKTTAAN